MINEYGCDSFEAEIRRTFSTPKEAVDWEEKVLKKMWKHPNCLNGSHWRAPYGHSEKSKIAKQKIGHDGLNANQRGGMTLSRNLSQIDPKTGMVNSEIRKRKIRDTLEKEGKLRNGRIIRSDSHLEWLKTSNPAKLPGSRKKISETLKEKYKNGYTGTRGKKIPKLSELGKGNQYAKGLKWYNDGIKNFRLKCEDIRIVTLKPGRISFKT